MNNKTSTQDKCIYCQGEVDTDEPGWGYDFRPIKVVWHSECYQMVEGIEI